MLSSMYASPGPGSAHHVCPGLTLLKMSVSRYATDNLLKVKIYINDSPQQQIVR
jgi:hypothetical protein